MAADSRRPIPTHRHRSRSSTRRSRAATCAARRSARKCRWGLATWTLPHRRRSSVCWTMCGMCRRRTTRCRRSTIRSCSCSGVCRSPSSRWCCERTGDPANLAPALRTAVAEIDGGLVPDAVSSLEARILTGLARPRLYAMLVGGFALLALLVASVGLFGVLSYSIAQRRRELAVRSALGATRADIMRLVFRQGSLVAGVGVVRRSCRCRDADAVAGDTALRRDGVRPDDVRRRADRAVRRQRAGVPASCPSCRAGRILCARCGAESTGPQYAWWQSGRGVIWWDFDGTLVSRPVMWGEVACVLLDREAPGHTVSGRDDDRSRLRRHAVAPRRSCASGSRHPRCVVGRGQPTIPRDFRGGRPSRGRDRSRTRFAARRHPRHPPLRRVRRRRAGSGAGEGRGLAEHDRVEPHPGAVGPRAAALASARHFDTIVSSGVVGYEKPHRRLFEAALRHVRPGEEVWMIGDNPDADCRPVCALGMRAVLVRGARPGPVRASRQQG